MSDLHQTPREIADQFARQQKLVVTDQLGAGYDGTVYSTNRPSAVKVLKREELYQKERDVYLRLQEHDLDLLAGFAVPRLIEFDDELQIVEMEIVSPPCVLDFAAAYLDEQPPFSEEELLEWMSDRAELFESDWPAVRRLYFAFQRYGICLADLKPGNIMCASSAE